eukprot:SAG11_NODE_7712_length_1105_cov_2.719682_1_plen_47_part_01
MQRICVGQIPAVGPPTDVVPSTCRWAGTGAWVATGRIPVLLYYSVQP